MSQNPPPVPLINPILLEKWNELPPAQPLGLDLTRQEWDLVLSGLLDITGAISSLAAFAASDGPGRDWQSFNEALGRNSNAQARVVRFIETVMLKATHNG